MMTKTGIQVTHYCTVFKYIPPIPYNNANSQDGMIVSGTGVDLAPKFVLSGNSKDKVEKLIPPDELLMDNLETSLAAMVDKSHVNTCEAIVDRFIKPRASTMFGHRVYSMDGP